MTAASTDGAAEAFARYTAPGRQPSPWMQETVEIDASLPKLAKAGKLRAIRRLLPFGQPQYQVLEIEGDRTVKQQVINRYLTEDEQNSKLPPEAVAITPANYKFQYKGMVDSPGGRAYVFTITPRKKRAGLLKGELWLDGESGGAVRISGYLVKRPSFFVKRVEILRETQFSAGIAEVRITHLSIDTRIVGRAELRIEEHPVATSDVSGSNE